MNSVRLLGTADICSTSESVAFSVRVTWGISVRIAGSTSSSSRFTRAAIVVTCSIVALKFSTAAMKSLVPRWNWATDLEMPLNGFDPANIDIRSPNPPVGDDPPVLSAMVCSSVVGHRSSPLIAAASARWA